MGGFKLLVAIGAWALLNHSSAAFAENEFYVFGAFGRTDASVSLGGLNRVADDDSGFAFGAGYEFTQNFSVEGAYVDFGKHYAETDCPPGFACLIIPVPTQADMTGLSLSLTGALPVTDSLDLYARIGFISWDAEFDGISAAFDTSGEDLLYGAGARWSVDDHWDLFAEFEHVDLDLDTAALGVSYRF